MKKLILKREYLKDCTIGKLFSDNELICYTIERPWLNNKKSESCIPAGLYDLNRYDSAAHPDCFYLTCHNLGVGLTKEYHRNYILIHSGNYVTDIEGCVAPGLELHQSLDGSMVVSSRDAMNKLRPLIYNNEINKIEIL